MWASLPLLTIVGGLLITGVGVVQLLSDDEGTSSATQATATSAASTTTTPAPTTTAVLTTTTEAVSTCVNEVGGYEVDYPAGWFEVGTAEAGPCQFFHPEPFEVPEFGEVVVAVVISQVPVSFDEWVAGFEPGDVFATVDRADLSVDGRRALRVAFEYGEGGVEPGTKGYEVIVEYGEGVLTVSTFEPFSPDLAATSAVVDDMAASLRLV